MTRIFKCATQNKFIIDDILMFVYVFFHSADGWPFVWSSLETLWCFLLLCWPSFLGILWTAAWLACRYPTPLMSVTYTLITHTADNDDMNVNVNNNCVMKILVVN